ncbi:cytochrome b [Amaricoccus sp. W119]|uniref:cytochrome b n=1 Tax=Amaricoccus sp. W119 TaxID=3391833 RepID=UPI0039A6C72C
MGYGTVSRLFHWITVAIVIVMIPVGLTMVEEVPRALQDRLFILHKGLGACFLVFILARIAWRVLNPPPPLPADLPRAQRLAASAVHLLLYALLLTMAVSGYVRVTAGGFPIELFDALGLPPAFGKNEAVAEAAKAVHATAKTVLIAAIALHLGAALYHGLVLRDGILARMWPPVGRVGPSARR